mmetsp:Transcript_8456/g.31857  ORF Transcript_8456/g.31857 Transcript_8456/m.31857 type:complete len:359 (-) Transcript_8456:195-1271(-)
MRREYVDVSSRVHAGLRRASLEGVSRMAHLRQQEASQTEAAHFGHAQSHELPAGSRRHHSDNHDLRQSPVAQRGGARLRWHARRCPPRRVRRRRRHALPPVVHQDRAHAWRLRPLLPDEECGHEVCGEPVHHGDGLHDHDAFHHRYPREHALGQLGPSDSDAGPHGVDCHDAGAGPDLRAKGSRPLRASRRRHRIRLAPDRTLVRRRVDNERWRGQDLFGPQGSLAGQQRLVAGRRLRGEGAFFSPQEGVVKLRPVVDGTPFLHQGSDGRVGRETIREAQPAFGGRGELRSGWTGMYILVQYAPSCQPLCRSGVPCPFAFSFRFSSLLDMLHVLSIDTHVSMMFQYEQKSMIRYRTIW